MLSCFSHVRLIELEVATSFLTFLPVRNDASDPYPWTWMGSMTALTADYDRVMLCLRTLVASTFCLWEPWLTCGALSRPIRGLTALLERPGEEALRPHEDSEGSERAQPSSHPCQGAHHVGKPSRTLQTRPNAPLPLPRNPSPKN